MKGESGEFSIMRRVSGLVTSAADHEELEPIKPLTDEEVGLNFDFPKPVDIHQERPGRKQTYLQQHEIPEDLLNIAFSGDGYQKRLSAVKRYLPIQSLHGNQDVAPKTYMGFFETLLHLEEEEIRSVFAMLRCKTADLPITLSCLGEA